EEAEAGLGQITGQLRNIDAELRSLEENDARIRELAEEDQALQRRRSVALDRADHADESAFHRRAEVARSVTSQASAHVVVIVEHLADTAAFKSLLLAVLKGTSTRTTTIDALAERVLPRQLLELAESRDADGLAAVCGLGVDRARKLITHLDDRDILANLARVRLTDLVDFRLRDGAVDKSVDELSTGQKCSVTLPIVMSERERSLILDQPEDHLDNAFLVSNVLSALIARTQSGAQTIVATHNANIPVLGSAATVVVLASDGTTGRVEVRGPFDDDAIVDQITQLMEGGRDAFARRSSFYAEHGGLA
ncbi:MAG: ABC transporter ATP-binding protein, partial [Actinomycetota bacterium]|nr:ABC transporter ATP-binding protein [Actinomycetota bacterium]